METTMPQLSNEGPSTLHKSYSADQLTDWRPGTKNPDTPGWYQLLHGNLLYDGKYDGAHWTMFQGFSSFRLNAFQLKSIKWRGLNFKTPIQKPLTSKSGGWVFDWRDPRGPRPLTDRD
jgi:hypothetical protein